MSAVVTLILQLITAAPGAISSIEALYSEIKQLLPASDVTSLDAIFAVLNPKVNADLSQLATDAEKGAGGETA